MPDAALLISILLLMRHYAFAAHFSMLLRRLRYMPLLCASATRYAR